MHALPYAAMLAVCAQGLWKASLWKAAEPRVMAIARDQFTDGFFRSLTFAGMPFLEKPPFYYDLTAAAFHVAGGPSVMAARAVVMLLSMLWVIAIIGGVRRAAGAHAGMIAGALLVAAPGFETLTRHLGVDTAMCSMLSIAMIFLFLALIESDDGVDGRWLAASIAAAGLAALSKGVFATGLYLAPTLVYAVVARDKRIVRALLRPWAIALLLLPHALWALVLYSSGGSTYVFEHFINNTVGRALHHRFDFGGTLDLDYGDVGNTYDWYYYIRRMPTSALPAVLAVPAALLAQRRRGGLRAIDPESRLMALCVCWGGVPPLLLSFSSYKGRGHLAASTAALVIIGALWIARRTREALAQRDASISMASVALLYGLAPLTVIAGAFGAPATRDGAHVLLGIAIAVAIVGLTAALYRRAPWIAAWTLVAGLTVGYVIDFSPGLLRAADNDHSMDAASIWVAGEVETHPVAVYYPRVKPRRGTDRIGWSGEEQVGVLSYWLGRPVVRLRTDADIRAYLDSPVPAYFVAHRHRPSDLKWPRGEEGVGWSATACNDDDAFVLIANGAAAAMRSGPLAPPPRTTISVAVD